MDLDKDLDIILLIFLFYLFYLSIIDLKCQVIKNKQLLPILFLSFTRIIISILNFDKDFLSNFYLVLLFDIICLSLYLFKMIGGADLKLLIFIFIVYPPTKQNGIIPIIDIYEFLIFLLVAFYLIFLYNYFRNNHLFKKKSGISDSFFDINHKKFFFFGNFVKLEQLMVTRAEKNITFLCKYQDMASIVIINNKFYVFEFSNLSLFPIIFLILNLTYIL